MRIKDSKHWRPDDPAWSRPDYGVAAHYQAESFPVRQLPSRQLQRKRSSGRQKLTEEAHCRMCLRHHSVRPLSRHHLVKQEWFRLHRDARWVGLRNCDACIVPLCRSCHDDVERDAYARRLLRRALSQAEIAFCIAVRGKVWFDRRYPSGAAVA